MNKLIALVLLAWIAAASNKAQAVNVLVDPGFESNPLSTLGNVITNFPGFQGQWGPEVATITGIDGAITPAGGTKMLRMTNSGGGATQTIQVTDITSYAAQVDAGLATIVTGALFNVDTPAAGVNVSVSVSFHDATALFANQTGPLIINGINLDGSPTSWEPTSVGGTIPVGTRWILSQVAIGDVLLGNNPGYVDDVYSDISIVPEPVSIGTLLLMGSILARRRRSGLQLN